MNLRWGDEKIKNLSKPVIKVERVSDWLWWLTGGVCVLTIIWLWWKIIQIYAIHLWLETI